MCSLVIRAEIVRKGDQFGILLSRILAPSDRPRQHGDRAHAQRFDGLKGHRVLGHPIGYLLAVLLDWIGLFVVVLSIRVAAAGAFTRFRK